MANFPVNLKLKAFDGVSAKFAKINEKFQTLGNSAQRLKLRLQVLGERVNFKGIAEATKGAGAGFTKLSDGIGKSLTRLAGVTATATAAFVGMKMVFNKIDDLGDLSQRLNMNAESLQELQHAAQLSGMKTEDFNKALEKMNVNVGQAKLGTGALFGILKKHAPTFLKQVQNSKDAESSFDLLANALHRIKDPAQKSALAVAAFGKAGLKLLNVTADGPEGIKKLRMEAQRLGLITNDTIKSTQEFNDEWDRLTNQMFVSAATGLGPIIPVLSDLARQFTMFIVEMRPEITKFAQEFARELPGNIKILREELVSLKETFGPIFAGAFEMAKKFGLIKTTIVGLTAFIAGPLVLGFAAFAASMAQLAWVLAPAAIVALKFIGGLVMTWLIPAFTTLAGIFLATPLGWITILAGGAYLIIKHWTKVKDFFSGLWDGTKEMFSMLFGDTKPNFKVYPGGVVPAEQSGTRAISGFGGESREIKTINSSSTQKQELTVNFKNAPPGMKVKGDEGQKGMKLFVNSGMQGAFSGK